MHCSLMAGRCESGCGYMVLIVSMAIPSKGFAVKQKKAIKEKLESHTTDMYTVIFVQAVSPFCLGSVTLLLKKKGGWKNSSAHHL